jgi:hypothetical protein
MLYLYGSKVRWPLRTSACAEARVLHWPWPFRKYLPSGGFDCVLGNPPWERIKLQEEEFFATRHRDVAEAKTRPNAISASSG